MQSIFATRLKLLMDDGGLFNREEWTQFLSKDEKLIDEWLTDKAFPEPDILQMIMTVFFESVNTEPLRPFIEEMFMMPISIVTPFAGQLEGVIGECATLGEYLVTPRFQGFARCLKTLSREEMEKVLEQAGAHTRELIKERRSS